MGLATVEKGSYHQEGAKRQDRSSLSTNPVLTPTSMTTMILIFTHLLDSHPSSWYRRPRTRALRSPRTTFRPRSPRMANIISHQPPHTSLHLATRPIFSCRRKCIRPTRIRLPTFPQARCLPRDVEARSGDSVRSESGRGIWGRGHGAEVSSCRVVGEETG